MLSSAKLHTGGWIRVTCVDERERVCVCVWNANELDVVKVQIERKHTIHRTNIYPYQILTDKIDQVVFIL